MTDNYNNYLVNVVVGRLCAPHIWSKSSWAAQIRIIGRQQNKDDLISMEDYEYMIKCLLWCQ